jgi:hypothetical protein
MKVEVHGGRCPWKDQPRRDEYFPQSDFIVGVIHSRYINEMKCSECVWLIPGQHINVLEIFNIAPRKLSNS